MSEQSEPPESPQPDEPTVVGPGAPDPTPEAERAPTFDWPAVKPDEPVPADPEPAPSVPHPAAAASIETPPVEASPPSTPDAPASDGGAGLEERAQELLGQAQVLADQRPEVAAGAAFAGGFVIAMLLKRLGR